MATLGEKIKYFRHRAGLSQFDLELSARLSNGMLSRIENNEINPTKETLVKIVNILKLNAREQDYIYGVSTVIVSSEEVKEAIAQVSKYFATKGVLAYLLDDRWRLLHYSDTFVKFLNLTPEQVKTIVGKTMIEILINDDLHIKQYLDDKRYEEMLFYQLSRFYSEKSFMFGDEFYNNDVKLIESNKIANSIWKDLINDLRVVNYHDLYSRKAYFKINMFEVEMSYSREPLASHPRFEVIEFIPTNKLIKYLSSKV